MREAAYSLHHFFDRDREIAHPLAGGVKDRVGDRRRGMAIRRKAITL
jgi:hypothetical protein